MWPFKKKIDFKTVSKFNYELDTNQKLKSALNDLSLCRSELRKKEYLTKLLNLFKQEGLVLTLKELDMLLLLREKTDQLMLEKEREN